MADSTFAPASGDMPFTMARKDSVMAGPAWRIKSLACLARLPSRFSANTSESSSKYYEVG
jgi:hypothetical protein